MLKASHLAKARDLETDVLKDALAKAERRADENERLAKLLQAVAAASRRLISEPNFEHGVHDFLETIATSLNAARAAFYRRAWHPDAGRDTFAVLDEWCRPGLLFSYTQTFDDPLVIDPAGAEALIDHVFNGEIGILQVSDLQEPMRSYLQSQGNETVIVVPVIIGDEPRYFVGFDSLVRRDLDNQTKQVLLTAADAMAAAVRRWEVEADLRKAEAVALAAERERADVAEATSQAFARHRDLLEAVVAASDRLLAAASLAEAGDDITEHIGKAMHVDRILIGQVIAPSADDPIRWFELRHEWTSAGTPRQSDDPELARLDASSYEEFHLELDAGRSVALVTEDLTDPVARAEQEATGAKSQFQVPILVDGALWGTFGGDDCTVARRFDDAEIATLQLAASAVGSVVKREQLTEARLTAERAREAEKAQRAIAILEERNRIAHDVHDALAQGFTGVNLQLQAARGAAQRGDQALAVDHIANATALARKSLAEARESVYQLRPSQLKKTGLVVALEELVARQGIGALAIAFKVTGTTRPLADAAENALLRTAQEGLSNVTRHARAKNCVLRLVYGADGVSLSIRDDGTGFDPDSAYQGMGLAGMRARADQLGARLLIGSSPGAGTEIVFALGGENG
jgi:signal transduction histidine kinase